MTEPNSPREVVERHRAETSERLMKAAMAEIDNIPGVPQSAPMGESPTPRFKVGDVVALRSGGPRMTVWRSYEVRCVSMVDTNWFAGDLLQRDAFAEAELEFAPPKETP
jgi:uncharacterized protein YodC (DUF2158 family)